MDKYTVDLDQVLNDFEYSELTDQHSKNVAERAQSNVTFQPPPVTKHSINNVFHSLNEYLNSGINDGGVGTSSLRGDYLSGHSKSLSVSDNKLDYNSGQHLHRKEELHNNISKENASSSERVSQHEQLKFKDETTLNVAGEINNFASSQPDTDNLLDSDICQDKPQEITNLSEHPTKRESGIASDEPTIFVPEQINISDNFEKINVDSIKTETPNVPVSETGQIEEQSLPALNCEKSFIEKKSTNVNIKPECDRDVFDKADSELDEVETNCGGNESYFDCPANVDVTGDVISTEISEGNVNSSKDATEILVHIDQDSGESVNTQSKLEGFVIEVSESPYAIGASTVTLQEKADIPIDKDLQSADKNQEEQLNVEESLENPCLSEEDIEEMAVENIETSKNNEKVDIKAVQELENLLPIAPSTLEDSSQGNVVSQKVQKIISFSADIDIDERELNKMLEELELEGEDLHLEGDVPFEKLSVHVEEHLESQQEINAKETSEEDDVGEGDENNTEVAASQIQEGFIGTGSNTKPGDIDSQTTETITNNQNEKNIRPQFIECLEMEKPRTKPKKSTRSEPQCEQSNESVVTVQQTQEILEEQSEQLEQEVKNEELSTPSEKDKQSVSRPQNLPLNNEFKDESVGRKINLIGSPGSTPYNNVYINKSIEPKTTTQDTESDYTSSASPTFSDCSTESTSTASTVSVENVPNNADKFVKKSLGVKNTNVVAENNELVRAQDTTRSAEEDREVSFQANSNNDDLANQNSEKAAVTSEEETTNVMESALTNPENGSGDSQVSGSQSTETFLDKAWLGKEAPLWIPDADAAACLHCDMKFTVLKRRHHCRACGLVLCSKCCNLKFRLEYLDTEARVCQKCHGILNKETPNNAGSDQNSPESGNSPAFRPNPNNPLEYCSTVSPLQQAGQAGVPPPSVMVPVGVLKRKGSNKKSNKSVMFCDGIAPGSDLTHLDQDFNYSDSKTHKNLQKVPEEVKKKNDEPVAPRPVAAPAPKVSRNQPKIDEETGCFIPKSETSLPPTISVNKTDILYSVCSNAPSVVEMLKNEALVFAINQNLFVHVRVINMGCCINKQAWCFCSEGLINVGSDEVVYLIEYIEEESFVPKDVFFHMQNVYVDAVKGTSIKELGLSLHNTSNFLDSKNHAGFVYIKPTFQCLENVIVPKEPYLIGILIHRWETPWAKLFPLRLILRLGAEYRYYPSPLISTRHRDSVFVEIGHTIINLLADFRNFTYTLPQIRGLIIHMEDKRTTITIPKNRYDQVMKSINNSSEHILAFAGNFSPNADSHLVCIQDTQGHENCYTTHAINIHNKPRKITGASFIVFNGSLKSSSGLTAKSNIVEDGLMIQIPSEHMEKIRENLRNMKNHTIACGCINATSDETVNIVWGDNDVDFNTGITSPVDLSDMKGVPSIRVHNGKDYLCNNGTRLIRWTEVFILQNGEENPKNQDPVDISKVSESIAKASCTALVKYLDLLVSNSCQKIGIRTTLHVENVSYSAGSNGVKLTPIYMRSLDNELVPVLHRITSNNLGDNAIVLELIFRILNA